MTDADVMYEPSSHLLIHISRLHFPELSGTPPSATHCSLDTAVLLKSLSFPTVIPAGHLPGEAKNDLLYFSGVYAE